MRIFGTTRLCTKQRRPSHGSVLMETVLVLPVLLALIGAVAQIATIYLAQVMTTYAAYNAARAALVHNPAEYPSVCRRAAEDSIGMNGAVRLAGVPQDAISMEDGKGVLPAVKATVEFDLPLAVPVVGKMFATFAGNSDVHPGFKLPYITLTSSAMLPKPWSTARY